MGTSTAELPESASGELDLRVGLLGELQVEQRLVEELWHPVRLDTAQMAANADLIAVNRKRRVAIQVKTSNNPGGSHRWLSFGYASGFLRDQSPFFNSKKSPLIADVVIAVSYFKGGSRFVVMPVALAESLCQYHAKYWYAVPTTRGKSQRSMSFPIYLSFNADRLPHAAHHSRIKKNVRAYENAWHLLKEDIEKLHDPKAWPLV